MKIKKNFKNTKEIFRNVLTKNFKKLIIAIVDSTTFLKIEYG